MADPGKEPEGPPPCQLRHEGPKKLRPPPFSPGLVARPPPPPFPHTSSEGPDLPLLPTENRRSFVSEVAFWKILFAVYLSPPPEAPAGYRKKNSYKNRKRAGGGWGGDPAHFTFSFSPASLRHKEASTEKRRSFVQGHLITKRQ